MCVMAELTKSVHFGYRPNNCGLQTRSIERRDQKPNSQEGWSLSKKIGRLRKHEG